MEQRGMAAGSLSDHDLNLMQTNKFLKSQKDMTLLSKDLIAASASPIILSILSQGDSYGYAIIQRVRELSEGEMEWADGMLYPILHRLERQKFIESYWGKAESGRKRKYYRLRKAGTTELGRLMENWNTVYMMVQKSRGVRTCST